MTEKRMVTRVGPSEPVSVPPEWQYRYLSDVTVDIFDCPHSTPKVSASGPLMVRTQDIRDGIFRADSAVRVTEKTYQERISRAEPRQGDLLYSREGTYFGIAAEVPPATRVCLGQRMVLIRPDTSLMDARFLLFWLNSPFMARHVHGQRDGSVAERLNMATIRRLPVPLPQLVEQRQISRILGALDDKIELNRRMSETLEETVRTLFRHRFLSSDHGRVALPADAFFEIVGGGTPKTSEPSFWGGEIPWFSVVDTPSPSELFVVRTEKAITRLGLESSSARLVDPWTTIISARGTVGNLAMAALPMAFNQSCYALVALEPGGPCFVNQLAQHLVDQLKRLAHGSVFSTITRRTFAAISFPQPTARELTEFEATAGPLYERVLTGVRESGVLRDLRDALLPKLISGELRVPDAERLVSEVT